MKAEEWIKDPVFQLNLLLWMAKEQPDEGWVVRPYFWKNDFQWLAVELPFPFPPELAGSVKAVTEQTQWKIHCEPEPELILKRDRDFSALYFEAKASSFSSNSSTASQARGHLLAVGPVFAEVYTPLQKATLTYVLPHDQRPLMEVCLSELSAGLAAAGLQPGVTSVAGLAVQDRTILYRPDLTGMGAVGCTEPEVAVLQDLNEETDPGPLLLVFSEQDCADPAKADYYRHILQQQIIATLLCEIHRTSSPDPVVITAADLLRKTTQKAFDYMGGKRQKAMELLVKKNIFDTARNHWADKAPGLVAVRGRTLTLDLGDPAKRDDFFEWLESPRKAKFPTDAPPAGEQLEQSEFPL